MTRPYHHRSYHDGSDSVDDPTSWTEEAAAEMYEQSRQFVHDAFCAFVDSSASIDTIPESVWQAIAQWYMATPDYADTVAAIWRGERHVH